jgi:hypothetical protein
MMAAVEDPYGMPPEWHQSGNRPDRYGAPRYLPRRKRLNASRKGWPAFLCHPRTGRHSLASRPPRSNSNRLVALRASISRTLDCYFVTQVGIVNRRSFLPAASAVARVHGRSSRRTRGAQETARQRFSDRRLVPLRSNGKLDWSPSGGAIGQISWSIDCP